MGYHTLKEITEGQWESLNPQLSFPEAMSHT